MTDTLVIINKQDILAQKYLKYTHLLKVQNNKRCCSNAAKVLRGSYDGCLFNKNQKGQLAYSSLQETPEIIDNFLLLLKPLEKLLLLSPSIKRPM